MLVQELQQKLTGQSQALALPSVFLVVYTELKHNFSFLNDAAIHTSRPVPKTSSMLPVSLSLAL